MLGPIDSLALTLDAQLGKHEEAEALTRRSLAIRKATFGEDSLEVAKSLERLGVLLTTTNRRTEAEPLLRKALAIREKAGVPEVASSMGTLANLLKETGHRKEAKVLFRRALEMLEKAHGPNSTLSPYTDARAALRGARRSAYLTAFTRLAECSARLPR